MGGPSRLALALALALALSLSFEVKGRLWALRQHTIGCGWAKVLPRGCVRVMNLCLYVHPKALWVFSHGWSFLDES